METESGRADTGELVVCAGGLRRILLSFEVAVLESSRHVGDATVT